MKPIIIKIVLFLLILATPIFTLFVGSFSPKFAFHFIKDDCYNHGAWIYDRITQNARPIDVAFIGSSHTIHAFQEEKMERQLDSSYLLANLGYCRYGRNLQYVMLKFLIQHKSPKLIVIEVHEDEEKNSHDIFPYLADTKDLLLPPTPFNRDYFSDLFRGTSARLECFKATYIFRQITPDSDFSPYGYANEDRVASEVELRDNENAWRRRLARTELPVLEDMKMKYPLAYLDKMTGLLNEKKTPFIFVYLPEFGSKLKIPKHAEFYKKMGTLLYAPDSIFSVSSNWMDASHFNNKGSALFSEWMTLQLKQKLCVNPEN